MGDFTDQSGLIEADLEGHVGNIFNQSITWMEKHVNERFNNNSFHEDGRSFLAYELGTYSWILSTVMSRDELQIHHREATTQRMAEHLVGQVLRSAQCHIKCLQLDPDAAVDPSIPKDALDTTFNPHGFNIGDSAGKGDHMDLATFYPEVVLAQEANSSTSSQITPTLQCQ